MIRGRLVLVLAATVALAGGLAAPAEAAPAGPAAVASDAELIPLPPPGQPVVSELTPTSARLTWTRSAGPVFRHSMSQFVDGAWRGYASMPFTTFVVGALTPGGTYTFAVQSHALWGSGYTSSPLSPPVTFTTPLS
ncbi:fibronectin type III domain-containing protein [Phytohabitans sp. LJ34]|uniref:fibronectin type III domain-containing protein n=1 Tax=Phytohabitans sp. LJ34 TaxID=3452217 RepID=UPI003F8980D2